MKSVIVLAVGFSAAGLWVALAASPSPPSTPATTPSPESPQAAMVRATCATCHKLPAPDILPRFKWQDVMLDMAGLIVQGVGVPKGQPPPSLDFDAGQIAYYYESRAPRELPSPEPWPAVDTEAKRFTRHTLRYSGSNLPAAVANVRLLQLSPGAPVSVVAADMLSGLILAGDPTKPSSNLRLLGRVPHPCHVEAVDLDRDSLIDLVVADLGAPKPSDDTLATVTWLRRLPSGDYQPFTLVAGLPRVADVQAGDFDGDGDLDLVVAAFGWRRVGGILLLENRTTDWSHPVFVARTLDERAGAIHVPVVDLNKDGRLDVVALLSQQHEAVVAFLGDGKGGFRKETIDEAPHPAWGSSGLQLVDLDGDGDLDVLVTNGDMLDDYQLKPYHGIRWLENRGGFPFVAHDIAPMFGVMRAQAADMDGDGDLDVVATAMVQFKSAAGVALSPAGFPSLVWLEQTADRHFVRHTLELGSQHLSLDLGDYDGDGDIDIAVANSLSQAEGYVELWENQARTPRPRNVVSPPPPTP